jgi:hypothetical protein
MESRVRQLALFNLGINSKLRGCDLVSLKVRDICHGEQVAARAVVMRHKTHCPVQFEITMTLPPFSRRHEARCVRATGRPRQLFVGGLGVLSSLFRDARSPHAKRTRKTGTAA